MNTKKERGCRDTNGATTDIQKKNVEGSIRWGNGTITKKSYWGAGTTINFQDN